MSTKRIKELLQQLQTELKDVNEDLDGETKQQISKLDTELNELLNRSMQPQDLYEGIMQLEYGFLNKHPMAANLMRGIVDMLSKTGI